MTAVQGPSSMAVMQDAQFGVVRTLKPLPNFEQYYQGQSAVQSQSAGIQSVPVPFFDSAKFAIPNYTGRDLKAGEDGYDPDLLDFIPVPAGALIKVWIPQFTDPSPENPGNIQSYRYQFNWRLSDINAYSSELNTQYHLGRRSPGAPDSTLAVVSQRFLTPAATRANIINEPESLDPFDGQLGNVRREYLVVRGGDVPALPLIPQAPGAIVGVRGIYQQGVIDPADDAAFAPLPVFLEIELITGGDKMLITADRFGENGVAVDPAALPSDWDFQDAGLDVGFSFVYGTGVLSSFQHAQNNNVGIYVFSGTGGG